MANKAGRPKAPVNITFTEEQVLMLIEQAHFRCEMQAEEWFSIHSAENSYQGDADYYQQTADLFALLQKLKDAHKKKYGGKNE